MSFVEIVLIFLLGTACVYIIADRVCICIEKKAQSKALAESFAEYMKTAEKNEDDVK